MSLRRLSVLLLLVLCPGFAGAKAEVRIFAPSERSVQPGEFVTLVFRIEAEQALAVRASLESELGWRVVRQPGELSLVPGERLPVAITVAVPEDAEAFTVTTLRLLLEYLDVETSADVQLDVAELYQLEATVPAEVPLQDAGFEAALHNRGNAPERVSLKLLLDGATLEQIEATLDPQVRRTFAFEVGSAGRYQLQISSAQGSSRTYPIEVRHSGLPELESFALKGEAKTTLGAERPTASLSLEGSLSDFTELDALIEFDRPSASRLELESDRYGLVVGAVSRDPYRLGLAGGFGVASSFRPEPWDLSISLGRSDLAEPLAYIAGRYAEETVAAALGFGLEARRPVVSGRLDVARAPDALSIETAWREGGLDARAFWRTDLNTTFLEGYAPHTLIEAFALGEKLERPSLNVTANLLDVFRLHPALRGGTSLDFPEAGIRYHLSFEVSLNGHSTSALRSGFVTALPVDLVGEYDLDMLLGTDKGHALLKIAAQRFGLSGRALVGPFYDENGWGVRADTRLIQRDTDAYRIELGNELRYYPGLAYLENALNLQAKAILGPLDSAVSANWNLSDTTLNLQAEASLPLTAWTLSALGGVAYDYQALSPWNADLELRGRYVFDVPVPESVTDLSGGRYLGQLQGAVRTSAGVPLAGVEIRVGSYRVLTDAEGGFSAFLSPGTYPVELAIASLPLSYRASEGGPKEVELKLRQTSRVDFEVIETATLAGRVLQDSEADGAADEGAGGVAVTLELTDAQGLKRLVRTGADGGFEVRGLVPGELELRIASKPLGSELVGEAEQVVYLESGVRTEVTFLVQPAQARARSFGTGGMRIRRISAERDRLPPGAAPLIRVDVTGEPERVELLSVDGEVLAELDRLEDGGWQGRLPLPADTPPSVLPYRVKASAADDTAVRGGQIVIDPAPAALDIVWESPVRAGRALDLEVRVFFEATLVNAVTPWGEVALSQFEPGRWRGSVDVPLGSAAEVYTLTVRAWSTTGFEFFGESRFRVDP